MNWFLIALIAPFLWAINNIIDNYLVDKYSQKERERSSGGLVLFSSLIGIFIASIIGIFTSNIFSIPNIDKILLILVGVLTAVWIIFYLYALEIDHVSSVAPWFLAIPVFGYILGYFFLGEVLNKNQIIGSIIIFIGLLILSIDFGGGNKKIKFKTIVYMILASLIAAVCGIIFKYVTVEGNFWVSSFWEYVGLGLIGIIIYIFIPKYRREFDYMNNLGGKKIFFLNTINELLSVIGNILTHFVILIAPVTMVYLVGSFQPGILLILTIIGTIFFPKIIKEDLSKKILIPKIIAIVIMTIGSILLI